MEPFPSVVKSANPSAKRAFTGTHYFPMQGNTMNYCDAHQTHMPSPEPPT